MASQNIDTIHSTIINNLKAIIEFEELSNTEDFQKASNIESLYSTHVLKLYSEYTDSPCQENINRYLEALNKFSIIEKYNAFVPKYKLPTISPQKNLYKVVNINLCECECGGQMKIGELDSTFVCASCGQLKKFIGIISNKITTSNGKVLTLRNNYCHINYFLLIYKNIFAIEAYEFSELVIELAKQHARSYCISRGENIKSLNCAWFRTFLSTTGNNSLFPHTNLLKKIVTGVSPPLLNEDEESRLNMFYVTIMGIFDKLVKKTKPRKSYRRCAFGIYKILDQILEEGQRKNDILSHIPLPKKETLENLDLVYNQICQHSGGALIYKPTINKGY